MSATTPTDEPEKSADAAAPGPTADDKKVITPDETEQLLVDLYASSEKIKALPPEQQEREIENFRMALRAPKTINPAILQALAAAYKKQMEKRTEIQAKIPEEVLALIKESGMASSRLQEKLLGQNGDTWLGNYYKNQQMVIEKYFAQATTVNDAVVGMAALGAMVGMVMQFVPGYEAKGQEMVAMAFQVQETISNKTKEQMAIIKAMNVRPTDAEIAKNMKADAIPDAVRTGVKANQKEMNDFVGRVGGYYNPAELTALAGSIATQGKKIGPSFFNSPDIFLDRGDNADLLPLGKNPAFDMCHAVVSKFEGGYANNPDDRGGATMYGIASKANPGAFTKVMALHKSGDVEGAQNYARSFYYENYYKPVVRPDMSAAEALVLYDTAVNMGVGVAQELSQKWGHNVRGILISRQQMYDSIIARDPSQAQFANSWNNRVKTLGRYVVQEETGLGLAQANAPVTPELKGAAAATTAARAGTSADPRQKVRVTVDEEGKITAHGAEPVRSTAAARAGANVAIAKAQDSSRGVVKPPFTAAAAKDQPRPATASGDRSLEQGADVTARAPTTGAEGGKPAATKPAVAVAQVDPRKLPAPAPSGMVGSSH